MKPNQNWAHQSTTHYSSTLLDIWRCFSLHFPERGTQMGPGLPRLSRHLQPGCPRGRPARSLGEGHSLGAAQQAAAGDLPRVVGFFSGSWWMLVDVSGISTDLKHMWFSCPTVSGMFDGLFSLRVRPVLQMSTPKKGFGVIYSTNNAFAATTKMYSHFYEQRLAWGLNKRLTPRSLRQLYSIVHFSLWTF